MCLLISFLSLFPGKPEGQQTMPALQLPQIKLPSSSQESIPDTIATQQGIVGNGAPSDTSQLGLLGNATPSISSVDLYRKATQPVIW